MEPVISQLTEENNYLKFTLSGVNVSIANSLRRIMLSEIPTFVFRTTPYEKNKVIFEENTSRLNNELLKQRISCIPIYINDLDFPKEKYEIELDMTNNTDAIIHVTSQDFRIRDTETNKYLTDSDTNEIFPPDRITNSYIDIARLRPKISDAIGGESLKLRATLDIGTAKEDSAFNVVSTCSYGASLDPVKSNDAWTKKVKELEKLENVDIESVKKDWQYLEAKRFIKNDSFDFVVESVGQFKNEEIVYKSAKIMIDKIRKFLDNIQEQESMITKTNTTIPNSFDIELEGEDYTLGKVIEYALYSKHYKGSSEGSSNTLSFCGFRKPHPHIDKSYIRLAFIKAENAEKVALISILMTSLSDIIKIYEKILFEFKSE
tara:strand:+ start:4847 stop:5974 length:1128 start_codon:yes stop_codon:yes gene_type:complete